MQLEKVSVIVPVYNIEKYLKECITSIITQDYKNIEILLIDDGSKDSSSKICDDLANEYNNIKVKHVKNGGVSRARNIGILLSTGKYLMFVDGDDYIEKNMVSTLVKKMKNKNVSLAVCNYKYCYADRIKIASFTAKNTLVSEEAKIELLKNNSIRGFMCNKIFISKIVKENNIFFDENIKICEDLLFCFKYVSEIDKAVTVNEPLYNYRMRKSSATNSGVENELSIFTAYKEMYKLDKKIYTYNEDFYAYIYYKYRKELKKNGMLNQVKRLNVFKCMLNKKIRIKTKAYIIAFLLLSSDLRNMLKNQRKQNLQYFE